MHAHSGGPIRLALFDDYDVILAGVAHLYDRYQDRVVVVELDANRPVAEDVDVALFDAFAQPEADTDLAILISNRHARRVAVYTWNFRVRSSGRASVEGCADCAFVLGEVSAVHRKGDACVFVTELGCNNGWVDAGLEEDTGVRVPKRVGCIAALAVGSAVPLLSYVFEHMRFQCRGPMPFTERRILERVATNIREQRIARLQELLLDVASQETNSLVTDHDCADTRFCLRAATLP